MVGEKYTKGEWKITDYYSPYPIKALVDDGVLKSFTDIACVDSKEDAFLISASKDMYEELVKADESICWLCKRLNPQHKDCTSCEERESRLKAIAKAEGTDKFTRD